MSPGHDRQLLKGVISLLLLHLLAEQESSGYELVQRLHAIGLGGILEGTVYPALARLEREGRVETRLVASTAGPARKYYRPTTEGYAALTEGSAHWSSLADVVTSQLSRPVPPGPLEGARHVPWRQLDRPPAGRAPRPVGPRGPFERAPSDPMRYS